MKSIMQRVRREFLQVLPPTIFFLLAFNVVALTTVLMLTEHGVKVPPVFTATLLALIVGKVILVADHLPFINRFPDKPLIYNILWKTFIYMLAVTLARYLEHFIPLLWNGAGVAEAHRHIADNLVWPRFVAIQIWLLVLFLFYAVLVELVRALGRQRVIKMFFGRNEITEKARP
jgi:hypothetical protein